MAKADIIKDFRVQIRDLDAPATAEPLYDLIQDNEDLTAADKQKLTQELGVKVNSLKQAEHDLKAAAGDKKGAEAAIKGPEDDKKSTKKKLKPVAESIAESEAAEEKPIHVPEGCVMKNITDSELKAINADPAQAQKLVGVKPIYAGKGQPSVSFVAIMKVAIALFLSLAVASPSFAASDDIVDLSGFSQTTGFKVDASGDLVPVTTNVNDIGEASKIIKTIYAGIISITTATIGTVTATTSVTAPLVVATQYVQLQYFTKVNRPASGATVGSVISMGGASATDCGVAGSGTVFAVCASNGTNWIAIS